MTLVLFLAGTAVQLCGLLCSSPSFQIDVACLKMLSRAYASMMLSGKLFSVIPWQVMSRAAMIEWIMLDGLRDPSFAGKGT